MMSRLLSLALERNCCSLEHEGYSLPFLKKLVEEDFKRQIVIINVNGNLDVVTLRSTAAKILKDFQNSSKVRPTNYIAFS